jgi:hypothetical protein
MAQVEFTQQLSYTYSMGGGSTGVQFFPPLQAVAGFYIVKGLSYYSTSGLNLGVGYSFQLGTSPTGLSGTLAYIFSTLDTTTSNEIKTVFSPEEQIILNEPYLGFVAQMAGNGDLVVNISYCFIPDTNPLSVTFSRSAFSITGTTGGGTTGANLSGISATVPIIIKSIVIVNSSGISGDVTILLNGMPIDNVVTLNGGESHSFTLPLYLTNAQTLSVNCVGSSPIIKVSYSYTQDPA